MDGNQLLAKVSSRYGAPMGRSNCCDDPTVTVTLFRVQPVDGDYDQGGAYWGFGDGCQPLYAAIGDGFEWYHRAKSMDQARSALADEFPELKIETPEVDPDFLNGYLIAALWSSTDDDGNPLDDDHSIDDISPEFLESASEDCRKFLAENRHLIDGKLLRPRHVNEMEYAGHDFWLTRNGHGAGFWDGDWETGEQLTDACKAFRELYLYIGDDGLIYCN